jgi:hypothetical protein
MHVFSDLQSYLCTHVECTDALKTFPSRKLWIDHEINRHFTKEQWLCFTCNRTTASEKSFVDHLVACHGIILSGHRLTAAITESKEKVLKVDFTNYRCALCSQNGWQSRKSYTTHMGEHLEEISLACLPRDENDSDIDLDSETSSHSAKTSVHIVDRLDLKEEDANSADADVESTVQSHDAFVSFPRGKFFEMSPVARLTTYPDDWPVLPPHNFDYLEHGIPQSLTELDEVLQLEPHTLGNNQINNGPERLSTSQTMSDTPNLFGLFPEPALHLSEDSPYDPPLQGQERDTTKPITQP